MHSSASFNHQLDWMMGNQKVENIQNQSFKSMKRFGKVSKKCSRKRREGRREEQMQIEIQIQINYLYLYLCISVCICILYLCISVCICICILYFDPVCACSVRFSVGILPQNSVFEPFPVGFFVRLEFYGPV